MTSTIQGLPVSKLISVSVTLTPSAAQGTNLNSCMIVGDSAVIDVVTRYKSYSGLTAVETDFGTTAPETLAATDFFAQNPSPTQLYIGRWAQAATPGQLYGGPVSAANLLAGAWTPVTSGAFFITIDGVPTSITGLNFGAITNMNGVATVIATALNSASSGATCTFNATTGNFEFQSGTTGTSSSMGFLTAPRATGFINFTGQPTANDTMTIQGTVVTFVASGATGNQVNIGGTAAITQASTLALLSASSDANLVKMTYTSVGTKIYITSVATGTAGNAYTLAHSATYPALSGATLSGGTGTDVSAMLAGLSTSSGAYVANGIAAETPLAALTILDGMVSFYGVMFAAGTANVDFTDAYALTIAAYVEASTQKHLFGVTTNEGAAITSNDTTSIGYQLKHLNYLRSFAVYSSTDPYAAASYFGRGVTVNYNGSNTTINFQWQQTPGIASEILTTSQSANLDSNRYNYTAQFANDTAIIVNGYVADGHYIDEVWNSDWLGNRIQTDVFNLLYTAGTKIPQTDAGMHLIGTTIAGSCQQGVVNGFLAPGVWNSGGFGQLSEGDFLKQGYYIYQPPISSQALSDRAARKSVLFQVAAKEAGAVNDVQINVTVNQ